MEHSPDQQLPDGDDTQHDRRRDDGAVDGPVHHEFEPAPTHRPTT